MSAALLLLIRIAEVSHGLPPGLLAAVVMHESNGHASLVTPERHGCSVGLGQVYLPGCLATLRRRLQDAPTNLAAAATLLGAARRRCAHPGAKPGHNRCCRPHWLQGYNCGSPGYAERVLKRWRRMVSRVQEVKPCPTS